MVLAESGESSICGGHETYRRLGREGENWSRGEREDGPVEGCMAGQGDGRGRARMILI